MSSRPVSTLLVDVSTDNRTHLLHGLCPARTRQNCLRTGERLHRAPLETCLTGWKRAPLCLASWLSAPWKVRIMKLVRDGGSDPQKPSDPSVPTQRVKAAHSIQTPFYHNKQGAVTERRSVLHDLNLSGASFMFEVYSRAVVSYSDHPWLQGNFPVGRGNVP